jgi:hypothetical protein
MRTAKKNRTRVSKVSDTAKPTVVQRLGAQGDCLFRRIEALPAGVQEVERTGPLVVAHSETGHHHQVEDMATRHFEHATRDPMICFLQVTGEGAEVVHKRPFDTHATIMLAPGFWEVRRQEEYTPAGWRRVED